MAKRILAPLNGGAGSEAIVPIVAAMADHMGSTVRLLRVFPVPDMVMGTHGRTIAYADQEMERLAGGARVDLARIESELLPPCRFIPVSMHFTMMSPAQRDRELITGLAPECPVLREAQMVGIAGLTSADQAGLLRHKPHMIAIANAAWLGMAQDGFVDRRRWHLGLCFLPASICCRRAL